MRRAQELPWQRAASMDLDVLAKVIVQAEMFELLYSDEHKADLWAYLHLLEVNLFAQLHNFIRPLRGR